MSPLSTSQASQKSRKRKKLIVIKLNKHRDGSIDK